MFLLCWPYCIFSHQVLVHGFETRALRSLGSRLPLRLIGKQVRLGFTEEPHHHPYLSENTPGTTWRECWHSVVDQFLWLSWFGLTHWKSRRGGLDHLCLWDALYCGQELLADKHHRSAVLRSQGWLPELNNPASLCCVLFTHQRNSEQLIEKHPILCLW